MVVRNDLVPNISTIRNTPTGQPTTPLTTPPTTGSITLSRDKTSGLSCLNCKRQIGDEDKTRKIINQYVRNACEPNKTKRQ
jgi:hypothetical protein